MQFVMFRAALALGLDRTVGLTPLGPLTVMGFDTNNPVGHTDAPPHVHIHPFGTRYFAPIPHYYYGDDGRLALNKVGRRAVKGQSIQLGRGERFEHCDPWGQLMYATEITAEGGLLIIAPSEADATITPLGNDRGEVTLEMNGERHAYCVSLDIEAGRLMVSAGASQETHRFDVDTGRYLGQL